MILATLSIRSELAMELPPNFITTLKVSAPDEPELQALGPRLDSELDSMGWYSSSSISAVDGNEASDSTLPASPAAASKRRAATRATILVDAVSATRSSVRTPSIAAIAERQSLQVLNVIAVKKSATETSVKRRSSHTGDSGYKTNNSGYKNDQRALRFGARPPASSRMISTTTHDQSV